jgi:hypothetical protein
MPLVRFLFISALQGAALALLFRDLRDRWKKGRLRLASVSIADLGMVNVMFRDRQAGPTWRWWPDRDLWDTMKQVKTI